MFKTLFLYLSIPTLISLKLVSAEIGITVDDIPAAGPNTKIATKLQIAERYLDTSRKLNLPKQFGFFNGVYYEGMQERRKIMKLWSKEHYVGNHTYSHIGLNKLGHKKFLKDIEKNESFLIDISQTLKELKYLRYPFLQEGKNNKERYAVRYYLSQRNYKIAQVSIDPSDWKWNSIYLRCLNTGKKKEALKVKEMFINHIRETLKAKIAQKNMIWGNVRKMKYVLLLHLNLLATDSLESMVNLLKKDGHSFIDAMEAVDDPIYLEDSTYAQILGKDFIEQNIITRKLTNRKEAHVPKVPKSIDGMCLY